MPIDDNWSMGLESDKRQARETFITPVEEMIYCVLTAAGAGPGLLSCRVNLITQRSGMLRQSSPNMKYFI